MVGHDSRNALGQCVLESCLNSGINNAVDCGHDFASRAEFRIAQHAWVALFRVNRLNEAS